MRTAEELQDTVDLLRLVVDAFLDDGVTAGAELTAAAALLTEAKAQLAGRQRVQAIGELLEETA
jgi:hypothetical protein